MKLRKKDYLRDLLIESKDMEYIDKIDTSPRNKEIIEKYLHGKSCTELANEYELSKNRPHQIIATFRSNVTKYKIKNNLN